MKTPKVSIIMGIYNCATTLPECIDSVISQTFTNWEFIICDDGSTDGTYLIAKEYSILDSRIKLFRNGKNEGLASSLNICLKHATGEYTARMDGDDRSKPDRLLKEVSFLEDHPEFSIVSSGMDCFDENGLWGRVVPRKEFPTPVDLSRGTPFCHAPCVVRREVMMEVNGYNAKSYRIEDYDLWVRLYALGHRGKNIMESLYDFRDDKGAVARRDWRNRIFEAKIIFDACRKLNLSWQNYIFSLRPLLVGLLPKFIYSYLRKMKRS